MAAVAGTVAQLSALTIVNSKASQRNSSTSSFISAPSSLRSQHKVQRCYQVSLTAPVAHRKRATWAAATGGIDDASDISAKDYDEEVSPDAAVPEEELHVEAPKEEDAPELPEADSETEDLKQVLLDSLYGTERGLRASSETRAEILELITQLEAVNPTPSPTEATDLLTGRWILAYTSYSELYPLLAASNLPFVSVGEIIQTINTNAGVLTNQVTFRGPVSSSLITTEASFEVRSPKRLQVKFEEGVIDSPEMSDNIVVPRSVAVGGQTIDLAPVGFLLEPLAQLAASIIRIVSGQPPLKFPIQGKNAQSWLLTTYLDADLRISRGDGGGIFVLVKAGSPLADF
eukprot:TRINITY_DN35396_c0_g1_i1.p1 TRINITY_DN35396_c0_g1~~TRINITY_DN35396_c0_g1_i1.p1  ORF type:complete len:345 (-),score=58.69 TRINITY_DN35396_c0_g1_i1:600-1634(-)